MGKEHYQETSDYTDIVNSCPIHYKNKGQFTVLGKYNFHASPMKKYQNVYLKVRSELKCC